MSEGYRTSGGALLQVGGHAGVVSWGESLQPNEPLGLMGSHEKGPPKGACLHASAPYRDIPTLKVRA